MANGDQSITKVGECMCVGVWGGMVIVGGMVNAARAGLCYGEGLVDQ